MGVIESITLLTLAASVAGGAWGAFRSLDTHILALRGDFDLLKWRLEKIEDDLNNNRRKERD
jgi:hypothetical protein